MRDKFQGSDGLFCFISTRKFDSFKNPFVTISVRSELYFRFRRFTLLVKQKSDFYELWQSNFFVALTENSSVVTNDT